MTYRENVKAILETNFAGFKDEIIEVATDRVASLEQINRCKDCRYFENDTIAKVDGLPLIVGHEMCRRWGNGCKTDKDGFCFLFEGVLD